MDIKEEIRRKRIKDTLRRYFQSEQGIEHRKHLSAQQSKRMANYANFLKNNNIKTTNDEN